MSDAASPADGPSIESPFVDLLGVRLVSAKDGASEIVLPLDERHMNTWGIAYGRVMHRSTTMAYCEGEVRDSDGNFVAKALGTFKYMRRLAVGRDIKRQRSRTAPDAQPGPSDA